MTPKLTWLVNRWSRMKHPHEEIYRLRQLVQNRLIDRYQAAKKIKTDGFIFDFGAGELFLSGEYDYEVRKKGHYNVFEKTIPAGHNQWRKDPKTEIESPIAFAGDIPSKDLGIAGESKYVFELNRLHVLPALAYRYKKEKCRDSLNAIGALLTSWETQNPYLKSINWTSGIEVGIRSLNLVITGLLLDGEREKTKEISGRILRLLSLNRHFLKRHLSLYSSANNHLLAELLGIIVIAASCNYDSREEDMVRYYKWFQEELLRQTFPDGGSREQSSHYHAAVLNAALVVLHFTMKQNIRPDEKFTSRIVMMLRYLDVITMGGNKAVHIGDKDDSNLLTDVFDDEFNLYQSLLYSGKRIFPDIKYRFFKEEISSEDFINSLLYENLFFKNQPSPEDFIEKKPSYVYLKHSGYFISTTEDANTAVLFDVGNIGFQPLAAHGHSDLLHFTFWKHGIPVISDAGTYQYHPAHATWRNYFKGISAHNTISLNGRDHAPNFGPMMWGGQAKANVIAYGIDEQGAAFCEAEHDGFPEGTHRRKIIQTDGRLELTDHIKHRMDCTLSYHLHFHPLVKPELRGDQLFLTMGKDQWVIANGFFVHAELFRGNAAIPLGWYSESYDRITPSYSLRFLLQLKEDITFKTSITEI